MPKIFDLLDYKTMLRLNIVAIIITAFCEIMVIAIFLTKGQAADLPHWKYNVYLGGIILLSVLLIASIVSLIIFFRKNRNKSN